MEEVDAVEDDGGEVRQCLLALGVLDLLGRRGGHRKGRLRTDSAGDEEVEEAEAGSDRRLSWESGTVVPGTVSSAQPGDPTCLLQPCMPSPPFLTPRSPHR